MHLLEGEGKARLEHYNQYWPSLEAIIPSGKGQTTVIESYTNTLLYKSVKDFGQ